MTTPIIETVVPSIHSPVPQRTQGQDDFNANADSFLASLSAIPAAVNLVAEQMNSQAEYLDELRGFVAADKSAVASDKAVVAADKAAVASDKATVAADKAAVVSDKATVAADKAAVASDKATVAADKSTVATDKATVAADKASVASNKTQVAQMFEAAGAVKFYNTYAEALADLSAVSNLSVVEIFSDETKGGARCRYRKEAGALAFKIHLDTKFDSIKGLVGNVPFFDGATVDISSFYGGYSATVSGPAGGGKFVWVASAAKSLHDGALYISPTVPWNGSAETVTAWQAKTGESQPSGSGCWRRITDGFDVCPSWWGSVVNNTSIDAAPALSKMWAYMLSSLEVPANNLRRINIKAVIPAGKYMINSSVNFTGLLCWNVFLKAEGAVFVAGPGCAGKAMFDASNVRGLHWKGGTIESTLAVENAPFTGLLLAPKGTDTCGNNRFDDLKINGIFSYAPYVNIGSETSYHFNCYFAQTATDISARRYAFVPDGMHSDARVVSDYTVLRANGVAVSFTNNRFYGCHFRNYGQNGYNSGSSIFMRTCIGWEFDRGCYYLTFDKAAFEIYNDPTYRSTNIKIDGSFETSQRAGMTDVIKMIVPDGGNCAIDKFHFSTQTPLASNSVIKIVNDSLIPTTGTLKLTQATIETSSLLVGAKMFDQCEGLTVVGHVGSRASSQLNIKDLASFKGTVYVMNRLDMDLSGIENKPFSIQFVDETPVSGVVQYNTASGPNYQAVSANTNASLNFYPKGAGVHRVNGAAEVTGNASVLGDQKVSGVVQSTAYSGVSWFSVTDASSGVLTVGKNSFVSVNMSSATKVTSIVDTFGAVVGMLSIRNLGSYPVTFVHSSSALRMKNGGNRTIGTFESIDFRKVTDGIWQEVGTSEKIFRSMSNEGVDKTGIVDSTDLFTAAGATGSSYFVESGTYKITSRVDGSFVVNGPVTITGGGSLNGRTSFPAAGLSQTHTIPGPHVGTNRAVEQVVVEAIGSGANFASNADFASMFRIQKKNWSNPSLAQTGEIDAAFFYVRQGGPADGQSACGAIVADVASLENTGFTAQAEMVSRTMNRDTLSVVREINTQMGVLNDATGEYYGQVLNGRVGQLTGGLLIQNEGGSTFQYLIDSKTNGSRKFFVLPDGSIFGKLFAPSKTWAAGVSLKYGDIRSNAGNWYKVINVGGTTAAGSEPVHTTGVLSNADGISWLFCGAGEPTLFEPYENKAKINTSIQLLAGQSSLPVAEIFAGSSTPDGTVYALAGSLFMRTDSAVGRHLYVNTSGGYGTSWAPLVEATVSNSVVAAGTTQATATTLTSRVNIVTSVPSPNNGVVLSAGPRDQWFIVNRGGNTLSVYPPSGAAIDGLAVNAPVSVASMGVLTLVYSGATQYYTV